MTLPQGSRPERQAAEVTRAARLRRQGHSRIDHAMHVHPSWADKRRERSALALRHKRADPEKEAMKREIAHLENVVNSITKALHRIVAQQVPSYSVLDEMMASLDAKSGKIEVKGGALPQWLIDALSSDD